MHKDFLHLLKCPKTGSDLRLEVESVKDNGMIESGCLIGVDGENKYPIINFIPRFVDEEHYSSSFGYEWKKWSRVQFESENIMKPMHGHTLRMFNTIADLEEENLYSKLIIEFGCGSGRFLDIVNKREGIAVGIDMSVAVESARKNFKNMKDVLIVQGDVLNPPFKNNVLIMGILLERCTTLTTPQKDFENCQIW